MCLCDLKFPTASSQISYEDVHPTDTQNNQVLVQKFTRTTLYAMSTPNSVMVHLFGPVTVTWANPDLILHVMVQNVGDKVYQSS